MAYSQRSRIGCSSQPTIIVQRFQKTNVARKSNFSQPSDEDLFVVELLDGLLLNCAQLFAKISSFISRKAKAVRAIRLRLKLRATLKHTLTILTAGAVRKPKLHRMGDGTLQECREAYAYSLLHYGG